LKEFLDNDNDNLEYVDLLSIKETIKLCNEIGIPYKIKDEKY